jgi:mRNA-degrading endonuclease RelE of RelBE toxin-antitoxin system
MAKKIDYKSVPEFDKELKNLLKRFSTLNDDIEVLKKNAIELFFCQKIDIGSFVRINRLKIQMPIFKVKKFASRSLKGKGVRSGVRIVFAFNEEDNIIIFLEIYYKEKDNTDCDIKRIYKYFD